MIKKYEQFIKEEFSYNQEGAFVGVKFISNSMELYLTNEGKEKIKEDKDLDELNFFDEYFEDIQVNSDIEFVSNLGEAGFGLTDAPGFMVNYDIDDKGQHVETSDSKLYYYNDYMLYNFLEVLKRDGVVIFNEQK
jgi:hypothetical protein